MGLSTTEDDWILNNHACVIHNKGGPTSFRKGGDEVECSISVSGVQQSERNQTRFARRKGLSKDSNRRSQRHAVLFGDGDWHRNSPLFTSVLVAGIRQPNRPCLLLDVSAGWDGEIHPYFNGLAGLNARHENVCIVIVAVWNIDANHLHCGVHPGKIGYVCLNTD